MVTLSLLYPRTIANDVQKLYRHRFLSQGGTLIKAPRMGTEFLGISR
jgi:hypothetical protein